MYVCVCVCSSFRIYIKLKPLDSNSKSGRSLKKCRIYISLTKNCLQECRRFYRKTIAFFYKLVFKNGRSHLWFRSRENIVRQKRKWKTKRRDETHKKKIKEKKRKRTAHSSLSLIRYLSSPFSGRICKNREPVADAGWPGSSIILYRRYEVSIDEVAGHRGSEESAR